VAHQDVVVVGASAGGVEALRLMVAGLPPDLPAAVLIVLHVPRSSPSALPSILARATALAVQPAVDGEPLRHGRIYVAPADRHLLIIDNQTRLSRGPSENGHRPAIDPLFRSAARAFGPRVVGVVLSGSRDDGAAGLAVIADRGGTTIVQDPADAVFSSMPRAAIELTSPDHVVPATRIGPLLSEITRRTVQGRTPEVDLSVAAKVAMSDLAAIAADDVFTEPAGYGCPACEGSLYEVGGKRAPRYRCRVGHAWSPESLLEEQAASLESALWMALRSLEDKAALTDRMASISADRGNMTATTRYRSLSDDAETAASMIRSLIEQVGATAGGEPMHSTE
jgi:two-component system, chemotaxis family, protein-glutamate methylesterase/glutaminase